MGPVFIGMVHRITPNADRVPIGDGIRVEFADVRPVRAIKGERQVIYTAREAASCGYEFRQGESYVVYAHRGRDGALEVNSCSRTRPVSEAAEDFTFFKTLSVTSSGARVFGTLSHWERDLATGEIRRYGPVPNVLMTLNGPVTALEARTTRDGEYEFLGVQPGTYQLITAPPPRFSTRFLSKPVTLADPRACYQADFDLHFDTRVRGSLVTPAGRPAAGIPIQLMPAQVSGGPREIDVREATSDPTGTFELADIPPGRYVIGIDLTRRPDAEDAFPRTFHPGTSEPSLATVLDLKGGETLQLAEMTVPPARRRRSVAGKVLFAGGLPVSGAEVVLHSDVGPFESAATALTASDGTFSLQGHEGLTYAITVWYRDGKTQGARSSRAASPSFVMSERTPPVTLVLPGDR